MAKRDVDPSTRRPVSGRDIGERIAALRGQRGLNKKQLAELMAERKPGSKWETQWRAIHKWEAEGQKPDRESLRLLAGVLGVTIEEIVGVAAGQDPPFEAWAAFLETPEGRSMDDGEQRALQAFIWPPGREPTVAGYLMLLAAMRGGSRERAIA